MVEEEEGIKTFIFRKLPEGLHRQWKATANLLGMTMEEFAHQAIRKYVKANLLIISQELSGQDAQAQVKTKKKTKEDV